MYNIANLKCLMQKFPVLHIININIMFNKKFLIFKQTRFHLNKIMEDGNENKEHELQKKK